MIVHLQIGDVHEYYGNMKAIFENHSHEELGVSYNYLKNYGLSHKRSYIGERCIIRKGIITTSSRNNNQ